MCIWARKAKRRALLGPDAVGPTQCKWQMLGDAASSSLGSTMLNPTPTRAGCQVVPTLSATAAEESTVRDGEFSPGAVIMQAQMCRWLLYISQGTAFVLPFSSFPSKKSQTLEV